MTGTRTASVTTDCARCVPNAPLLVGVIYCEAKIALSNSLAVLGVFWGFHAPFPQSVLSS